MRTRSVLSVVCVILSLALVAACGGGREEPKAYGVFLVQGDKLTEIPVSRGEGSWDVGVPKTVDAEPTLSVFLPGLVLDYLVIRDRMGEGDEIPFSAASSGDEIVELQPKQALSAGVYCLIMGDPLGSPADTPYYCFEVPGSTSVPTPGAELPPSPNPMAYETEVAAAATALVNPGNAATQAAAEQTLRMATATAEAAIAGRWQAKVDRMNAAIATGSECTSRVRPKLEAGDYSDIQSGADLTGCDLSGLNLFGLDFGGINLSYANLRGANLKGAKFNGSSNLDWADLRGATLAGVEFGGASMRLAVVDMPLAAGVPADAVIRSAGGAACSGMDCWPDCVTWLLAKNLVYWGPAGSLYEPSSGGRLDLGLPEVGKALAFSADGSLASYHGSYDLFDVDARQMGTVGGGKQFWSWASNARVALVYSGMYWSVADYTGANATQVNVPAGGLGTDISPEGQYVAACTTEGLSLLNARTGAVDRVLTPGLRCDRLNYSPGGQWVAAWAWRVPGVAVVAAGAGDLVWLIHTEGGIRDALWSPDSLGLALLEENLAGKDPSEYMSLWTFGGTAAMVTDRNSPARELSDSCRDVAWDPQGRWAAVSYRVRGQRDNVMGEIRVLSGIDGSELADVMLPGQARSLAVGPSGDTLAASYSDSLVFIPIRALASGPMNVVPRATPPGGAASVQATPTAEPTPPAGTGAGTNLLENAGFEEALQDDGSVPADWQRGAANSVGELAWEHTQPFEGDACVRISQAQPDDAWWLQTIAVEPNTDYRLSGWIRTKDVAHSVGQQVDAGANLCIFGGYWYTPGVFGTTDWTLVSMDFNSGEASEVQVCARLGYWSGTTTGAAWFDGLRLEALEAPARAGDLEPRERNGMYATYPEMTTDPAKEYVATITTAKGDMVFELYPDKAPLAVNSFVFLAGEGYYDHTSFHRVLAGFMAQGGDPLGTGLGGPGYRFANEVDSGLRFDTPGLLAMANAGPDTNGSQFFITYAAASWLDGGYTIFGRLIEGMDILEALTPRDPQKSPEFAGDEILTIVIAER